MRMDVCPFKVFHAEYNINDDTSTFCYFQEVSKKQTSPEGQQTNIVFKLSQVNWV